jgi:hypothetical protein
MSYVANGLIQVADYNALETTINTIYGVGNGEFGYGQSAISLVSSVTTANQVGSSQWKPLRNALQVCANHQATAITVPADPALDLNSLIHVYPAIPTAATNITTNRHVAPGTSMTIFPNQVTTTYSSNWSATLAFSFDLQWSTGDNARYFWNSGGNVSIGLVFSPSGTYPRGIAWSSFMAQLGGLSIQWNKTTSINTYPGTQFIANVGYYGLPTTPLLLYQAFDTQGSYAFPVNNITVTGQSVDGPVGVNGDNGTHLRYVITLNDVATTGTDLVIGNWTGVVGFQKATTYLTVQSPTCTLHSAFSGS